MQSMIVGFQSKMRPFSIFPYHLFLFLFKLCILKKNRHLCFCLLFIVFYVFVIVGSRMCNILYNSRRVKNRHLFFVLLPKCVFIIILLSIIPSIFLMLLNINCMVTGGNEKEKWWCWLYSWIVAILVIIYCIFIILISLTSLFNNNNNNIFYIDIYIIII